MTADEAEIVRLLAVLADRDAMIRRLRDEVEMWKDRSEAEHQAHIATIAHCDKRHGPDATIVSYAARTR